MALASFVGMGARGEAAAMNVNAAAFLNARMDELEARQCARIQTESTMDGVNSELLS
jgi:hypothetical protein